MPKLAHFTSTHYERTYWCGRLWSRWDRSATTYSNVNRQHNIPWSHEQQHTTTKNQGGGHDIPLATNQGLTRLGQIFLTTRYDEHVQLLEKYHCASHQKVMRPGFLSLVRIVDKLQALLRKSPHKYYASKRVC